MLADSLWLWAAGTMAAWVFLGLAAGTFRAARNGLSNANKAGSPRRAS